jgi:hypothetical protein
LIPLIFPLMDFELGIKRCEYKQNWLIPYLFFYFLEALKWKLIPWEQVRKHILPEKIWNKYGANICKMWMIKGTTRPLNLVSQP